MRRFPLLCFLRIVFFPATDRAQMFIDLCLSRVSIHTCICISLVAQVVKNLPIVRETQVWSLGWEDPLEKEMATHSSILAWEIPRTEEPGGLQSMRSQRVGHDWVNKDNNISTEGERQKVCVGRYLSCKKSKIQFYLKWSVRVWLWRAKQGMAHRSGPWCWLGAMADQLPGSWDQPCIGRGGEGHRPALLPVSREMVESPPWSSPWEKQ